MSEFIGKVVLVTGGSKGIGRAAALQFAEEGAKVVIGARNQEYGNEVVNQINKAGSKKGNKAMFVKADVSRAEEVEDMLRKTVEEYGRLDALVTCAGILSRMELLADYPLEEWEKTLSVNISGTFYAMKYAIPVMLESGGGSIVLVSSVHGSAAYSMGAAYVASKHALVGLAKVAALGYSAQGIRVNSIGPGIVETDLTKGLLQNEKMLRAFKARHPIGRFGRPEEIANLICFLCSDRASFMSGGFYPIDGGYLAH